LVVDNWPIAGGLSPGFPLSLVCSTFNLQPFYTKSSELSNKGIAGSETQTAVKQYA
jgi:hypothetical protein